MESIPFRFPVSVSEYSTLGRWKCQWFSNPEDENNYFMYIEFDNEENFTGLPGIQRLLEIIHTKTARCLKPVLHSNIFVDGFLKKVNHNYSFSAQQINHRKVCRNWKNKICCTFIVIEALPNRHFAAAFKGLYIVTVSDIISMAGVVYTGRWFAVAVIVHHSAAGGAGRITESAG